MNMLRTIVQPVGFQARIIMVYHGRTRVRYMNVRDPLSVISTHEKRFLLDMNARGKVLRKGRIV